jgi:hypothetical protein
MHSSPANVCATYVHDCYQGRLLFLTVSDTALDTRMKDCLIKELEYSVDSSGNAVMYVPIIRNLMA